MIRFFNDVSYAIRATLILFLGMANSLTFYMIMWLATVEMIQQMKEKHNEQQ